MPFVGAAPASWRLLIDEVHSYLTEELGIADDEALRTVLRVQHALLPSHGRTFPLVLDLAHDYAGWHRAIVEVKDSGRYDWEAVVPRLRDLPPATFEVDDPYEVCERAIGIEIDENLHGSWELSSSVARATSQEHEWDE